MEQLTTPAVRTRLNIDVRVQTIFDPRRITRWCCWCCISRIAKRCARICVAESLECPCGLIHWVSASSRTEIPQTGTRCGQNSVRWIRMMTPRPFRWPKVIQRRWPDASVQYAKSPSSPRWIRMIRRHALLTHVLEKLSQKVARKMGWWSSLTAAACTVQGRRWACRRRDGAERCR